MHRTTVWLTHDDTEMLRGFAFRERRTMSDVIREGIRLVVEAEPQAMADPEDIVSPRVTNPQKDWAFTPTEEAVLSLRNGRWSPSAIASDLALTEEQVLVLFARIDRKMDEPWGDHDRTLAGPG